MNGGMTGTPARALLEVDGIHTYYGDSYVLQGLSLSVRPGQIVAVMGRNGVGKTTLLRSIVGFTPASRGRVLLNGADITGIAAHRIRRMGIGLVPQGRRIFRALTVSENLQIAASARPLPGARPPWSLDAALQFFPRLRERIGHPGGKLSGGEQQMLASVRPLLAATQLLLLDESTEGLAPLMVHHLALLIERLKTEGYTMLVVEQNLDFVLRLADYVYIIDHGAVAWKGAPAALRDEAGVRSRHLAI
jgi:branched-chain amino acid transport system ATP-binding protein